MKSRSALIGWPSLLVGASALIFGLSPLAARMIAAIIFLPALCRWLLRPGEKDKFDVSHWHEKPDPEHAGGEVPAAE